MGVDMGGFFTVSHLGAGFITVGFAEVALLVWRGESRPWNLIILGFIAVLSGTIVANLTDVKDVLISLGGENALHLQREVEHVDAKAAEVQRLNQETIQLAREVESSNKKINDVRDQLRKTVRSLLTEIVYIHNASPHATVPQKSFAAVLKQINALAEFAYPNIAERNAAMSKLMKEYPSNLMTSTVGRPSN